MRNTELLFSLSEQNAKVAEETARQGTELASSAQNLQEAVQVFRTDVGGSSAYTQDAVALRKEMKTQASRQALSAPA